MAAELAHDLTIEYQMTEVLRRRGVRGAFFDLDDTLIVTGKIFEKYIFAYSEGLSARCDKDARYIFDFFIHSLRGLKKVFNVNPALLMESARITALHVGVPYYSPELQALTASLMEVYQGHGAQPTEGTHRTLELLRKAGIDRVLVTHASEENTYKKLKAAGINPRDFAHIFCIDDLGMKGPEEWAYSLQQASHQPQEVLVVGDNWLADILPALEIGVPIDQVIRILNDGRDQHAQAIESVAQLNNVGELPEHIVLRL